MTTTKTLSGSYQPHGTPLTKGSVSSSSTFIVDGFTNAPSVGETFQFGGTGTVYTINGVTYTGTSGEYAISISASVSQSDNTALQFVTSKTFSGLNTTPDMRGLTVFGTGAANGNAWIVDNTSYPQPAFYSSYKNREAGPGTPTSQRIHQSHDQKALQSLFVSQYHPCP